MDDINAAVMDLKEKKIRSLSEEAKIGAHGKPVIFLHPKDCGGVLVELEQAWFIFARNFKNPHQNILKIPNELYSSIKSFTPSIT